MTKERKFLVALFACGFLFTAYAVGILTEKHIYLDSGRILFQILQRHEFYVDYPQTRYLSTALQSPLLLFMHLAGKASGARWASYIYGFSHLFFLVLCFAAAISLAYRKAATWFVLIAGLAVSLGLTPSSTFVGSYVYDALALSLVLLAAYLFLTGALRLIVVGICCFAFAFSYEASFLLLAVLVVDSWTKRHESGEVFILGAACVAIAYHLIMAFLLVAPEARHSVYDSFRDAAINLYAVWAFLACGVVAFCLYFRPKGYAYIFLVVFLLGAALEVSQFGDFALRFNYISRVWVIPSLIPLFIAAIWINREYPKYPLQTMDILFLVGAVFIASAHDLKQGVVWKEVKDELLHFPDGCFVLDKTQTAHFEVNGMDHNFIPLYHILLSGKREPTSIVFGSSDSFLTQDRNYDPCQHMSARLMPLADKGFALTFPPTERDPTFRLDKLLEARNKKP